jgi:hypothetical protein
VEFTHPAGFATPRHVDHAEDETFYVLAPPVQAAPLAPSQAMGPEEAPQRAEQRRQGSRGKHGGSMVTNVADQMSEGFSQAMSSTRSAGRLSMI